MATRQFSIVIQQPPEKIFRLLADLPGYSQWLSASSLHQAVMDISENPVRLGTAYTDRGTASLMRGKVTEFDPPRRLTFVQSSHLPAGGMTIEIQYRLTPSGNETRLTRTYDFHATGLLRLLQPVLLRSINRENDRILQLLKRYLEGETQA